MIDLGTSRTRVFARGRGIVVNEPSLLAYDSPSREVVAVGLEALELEGRASEDIQIISPLQDGVVADSTFAGKLIASYIRKARDGRSTLSRRVLISIAADATDIEHYALRYAAKEAGRRQRPLRQQRVRRHPRRRGRPATSGRRSSSTSAPGRRRSPRWSTTA